MAEHVLEREQFLPRPLAEVFAFFSDPGNLAAITPESLAFEILTPPPLVMRAGATIDYRIRLLGIPVRWRTRIESWEPPRRFTDVQERGPYRSWHHLHEFEERDGGTQVRDRVRYSIGLGPLGELARLLFVRRDLERIFDHRRAVLDRRFGGAADGRRS